MDLDDTSSDEDDDADLSQKEKAKRARERAANDTEMHLRRLEDVESVVALR